MTPRRLVLVGSVLVDLVATVPDLPPRGGDVVAAGLPASVGGGFTVLAAAVRLGMPAVYAGAHGSGPFGDAVRAALAGDGVVLALAPTDRGDTGWCLVLVEPDGERTMVTVPGVEAELTPADLGALEVRAGDAVYVSGYDLGYPVNGPLLGPWLAALPAGVLLVVDPGPLVAEIPAAVWQPVLARVDVLTVNAVEAAFVGADRLPRDGALVVHRDGPRAATVRSGDAVLAEDVPPTVTVSDSTGAGDVHTGALLGGRAGGLDWPAALRLANAAAAWSVQRLGPGHAPTRDQLAR